MPRERTETGYTNVEKKKEMGERVSCWKARNMLANQLVKRQEKERIKDKTFLRHFIAAF
jgi:hypothetical protein